MALYTSSQGSSASRCPCLRNGLLPFQHGGLWSRTSHVRENLYGQWVCTHCPNGATVQKRAARGTSTLLARGTGDVHPGRVILARSAVPLAVQERELPTAPYGVRPARTGTPGCRAGMRSLRSDQPRARTVHFAVGFDPTVRITTVSRYDWR